MKKKLLSMLLAGAMVMSLLTGCGSKEEPTSASNAASNDSGSTTTSEKAENDNSGSETDSKYSEENPYKLTFAFVEFAEQDDAARQAVQDAMNEKLIKELHIEVELLPLQYAEYDSTIQLMMSGGDALDVMSIYYTNAASWISMGGVYNMNEFMDTKEGKAIIDAIGEENAFVGNMNGVLYGFPASKESVELGGLCMRADICDELGIAEEYGLERNKDEYDGTFYDWSVAEEIFAKVKEAYPEMIPMYLSQTADMKRFSFYDELVDGFGVLDWEADHDSVTVVNKYETESYKKAVTTLARWYDKGYIYKDAQIDTQGTSVMMKAGNTFSYTSAIKPGFLVEAEASNGTACYAMYFGNYKEGGITTTNVSFFNTGIASNSEDPEMAFKFISALYSDAELMNLWQNGIEGEHYQVLSDGTAYFVDGEDSANYAYHQNTGWYMGNQFISYVWNDGSKDADYWKKLSAHNDWAYPSAAFGFMWDSTDYATEITALKNALETYRAAIETGSVGEANVESTLEQLNTALKAAGLETVMTAKQEQLDAWLGTQ
ncbi:DUF3502 domain-containing protein [Lachnospiraceae bacterium OttesenSCG-928-D06]|nr:DUF3502 domain-containing protein [Lachnospiraceae bacterium OttesenSCG-928-D06]